MTGPGFYAQDELLEDGYYYMRTKPKYADKYCVYFGEVEGHTFYYVGTDEVEYLGRIKGDVEFYGPIDVPPSPWKEGENAS